MAFFEKASLRMVLKNLDAGADANARDEWGFSPLHFAAAFNDDPDVITALVDAGADMNARDKEWAATPLHWAAWSNGNPGIIIALLDGGADPNARDARESTPLHAAADQSNNPDIILTLLDSGADLDAAGKDSASPESPQTKGEREGRRSRPAARGNSQDEAARQGSV